MTVNERVKVIRNTEKLTMESFGEKLGVGRTAISNIENGKRNVTDQMIKSICREFNYCEEWLRNGIEPKQPEKLDEDELAEYIEELLSTDNPAYTLIKSILKASSKLDDKSKQVVNDTIDSLIAEIKKEG